MLIQMQSRRGTAAQWTSANTILAAGEFGFETDTFKVKIGDGTTAWASVPYMGATVGTIVSGALGGTGIANTGKTLTLSGNTVLGSSTHTVSLLTSANTSVTLPTSGTLLTGSSPTITTPTIDGIVSSAAGATNALWAATTTGSIDIGAGLTTGTLNLAAVGTGVTPITIGHTNATLAITTSGLTLTTGGLLTIASDLNSTAATGAANIFAAKTTGSIVIGSGIISGGSIQIGGTAVGSVGTLNILTGATTSGTKAINIGTGGSTGSTTTIAIGTTAGTTPTIALNGAVTVAGGALKPATGTATLVPLQFTAGTNLTSALAGGVEFDGDKFYLSASAQAASGRGYVYAAQKVISTANSTAFTTTTPVTPFTASNDVLTLETGKLYYFKGTYYTTATFTSGTAAIQLGFTFSNAPVGIRYLYKTYNQAAGATISLMGSSSTAAATTVSAGVTSTISHVIEFEGYFTSNATTGGTISPFLQMSTTGSSTVALPFSDFEIVKLGASATTVVAGSWA